MSILIPPPISNYKLISELSFDALTGASQIITFDFSQYDHYLFELFWTENEVVKVETMYLSAMTSGGVRLNQGFEQHGVMGAGLVAYRNYDYFAQLYNTTYAAAYDEFYNASYSLYIDRQPNNPNLWNVRMHGGQIINFGALSDSWALSGHGIIREASNNWQKLQLYQDTFTNFYDGGYFRMSYKR